MKIGHLDPKIPVAPLNSERKAGGAEATPTQPEPAALVEISAAASALSTVDPEGSFDSAKVERIAQAIRDGKYKIDPEAIADKLIANAQDLLGRSTR